MSTKKLSKTIIEGGRAKGNKWERRHSNSAERASSRDFCKKAIIDNEIVYDDFINDRDKVYKEFDDKLTPVLRWLAKQVGKKWDDVYSEIKQTFDVRTTAGRHIVYDHLIGSVDIVPDLRFSYYSTGDDNTTSRKYDFYVEDGILCQRKYIGRHHYKYHYTRFDRPSIASWLDGRMIAKIGNKYYWFVSSTNRNGHMIEYKTTWDNSMWGQLTYLRLTAEAVYDSDRKFIKYEYVWKEPFLGRIYSFRQDVELSSKDMEFWNSIPEQLQEVVLKFNPLKLKEKSNYRW